MTDSLSSAVYILVIILLVLIGARFLGRGNLSQAKAVIKSNAEWLLLLLLGLVISSVAGHLFIITANYTPIASEFFGNLPILIQASLQSSLLTGALSLLYLFSLPVILILTPLLFAKAGDTRAFRQFCLTISIVYIALALSHFFIPITRPALYPGSGVTPLLYDYPVLGNLTSLLGSKSHSFPSGHTSVIFATFLLLVLQQEYREYSILVGVIFLFILSR